MPLKPRSRHLSPETARIGLLVGPTSLLLVVLLVVPLGMMALFSFRAGTFGEGRQVFTLAQYQVFFASPVYLRLLWRSLLISFYVSIICVALAYPIAYSLVFRPGARRLFLLTVIIVPAWVSYLLRVLAWKVILGVNGPLASALDLLGLSTDGSVLLYSPLAVVITLIYVWIPFVALPIFAALQRIDFSLLEAAADLGCTRIQTFFRVIFPLSLPGVLAGFLFVFIPTVGEYVTPALVGGPQGIMFGNLIQDQFLRGLNWPFGSLMSLVMLVVVLVPLLFLGRFVRLTDMAGI